MTDIDRITAQIASMILAEEAGFASPEKDLQKAVSQEIESEDLRAPEQSGEDKKTITDEQEDDEPAEKEKSDDDEAKIEPDPIPGDDAGDDAPGGDDFEVEAIKQVPDRALTVDDIKDEINNLRAGRSLKDDGVSQQLADYFEKLGMAEERSLYVFLSSLAAILTGGTTGEEAPRPESMGVNINLRKKQDKVVKKSRPTVQTSGEQAPIVVGERADTYTYKMKILEAYTANDKHRCLDGRVVKFGTTACIRDLNKRIADVTYTRDSCGGGSADRASMNGTLKYLRQKMRAAQKIKNKK